MSISLGAAALIGGGSVLGGLLGAGGSYAASAEAVKKQIQWERERATHAHQWEVQDLINAGLNPVLSAGGSGATTGGISAPIPDTSGIANAIPNAINAIVSANDAQRIGAETQRTLAETKNVNEDTELKKAQTLMMGAQTGLIKKETALKELEKIIKQPQADYATLSFWNKEIGQMVHSANELSQIPGNILNLKGMLKGITKKVPNQFDFASPNFSMPRI